MPPSNGAESTSFVYRLSMIVPYALTAALVGLLIYCHLHGEPINISREDGVVEWGSTAAFALCGFLALAAAWVHKGQAGKMQTALLVLFGVVALLAVGEELSWGQRIFGFKPPAAMTGDAAVRMGHNDVTVHNLTLDLGFLKFSVGGVLFGAVLLGLLFVHGVLLPLQVKRGRPKAVTLVQKTGLFLPPLHLGILVLVGATFFQFRKVWHNTDAREYKEMLVPCVYFFILLHCFFRGRKPLHQAVTVAAASLFIAAMAWSVWMVMG